MFHFEVIQPHVYVFLTAIWFQLEKEIFKINIIWKIVKDLWN